MPIFDFANNPLQPGDAVAKLVAKLPTSTDLLPLDIYSMMDRSIRVQDASTGKLLLKRFLGGPQEQWAQTEQFVQVLRSLRSVADCPAPLLRYLQLHLGWTDDLLKITNKLSDDALRALLAASPGIWKSRGIEGGYAEILMLTLGLDYVFTWNWFDFRWVLDENALGEDRQGRDTWLIDLPGPPNMVETQSNLRIVDPTGFVDRQLVADCLLLFKPANERLTITWLEFADRFERERGWSGGVLTPGRLTVTGPLTAQAPSSRADGATGHLAYVRLLAPTSAASAAFGVVFRQVDSLNHYRATLNIATSTLSLVRQSAGVDTLIASFDFTSIGEQLYADQWYGLRIEVLPQGGTQEITIYVDGVSRIKDSDSNHASGGWALYAEAATELQCSDVEIMSLPGDVQEVWP